MAGFWSAVATKTQTQPAPKAYAIGERETVHDHTARVEILGGRMPGKSHARRYTAKATVPLLKVF